MKVLEFINENSLSPVGGPIGYCYALYEQDKVSGNHLTFLKTEKEPVNSTKRDKSYVVKALQEKLSFSKILFLGKHHNKIDSQEFDIIHFHSTLLLYKYRASLKNYPGKVVLTSHSPTLFSIECYQNARKWERILFWPLYRAFRQIDYGAFELADYIVFPCPEAEEPYEHAWSGFSRFKEKNISKFKYLLTGTYKRYAKKNKETVCKELNIPEDAIIISYVGRHNSIKGYDRLREIGARLLDKYSNLYFIICGKEDPLKGLKNARWVEIGWTNDPHSYIGASDLFVLPNRETYFDLVLLEVLSLGTPILASRTGGNRYFDSEEYPGIIEFEDINDAVELIDKFISSIRETQGKFRSQNMKVFDEQFSSEVFYDNYIALMEEIYEEG